LRTKWGLLNLVSKNAVQRVIYFKAALHRNTQIRKVPSQLALATDLAELRKTLREFCRPDFDEVEILLSSGSVYRSVPAGQSDRAISISLNLAARDGMSLGLLRLHRLKENDSPFLLDLQLVAQVLQPALSNRVFSLIQESDRFGFGKQPTAYGDPTRSLAIDPIAVFCGDRSEDTSVVISGVI
jgi:hypothetical protein